jgi:hypothetical protein
MEDAILTLSQEILYRQRTECTVNSAGKAAFGRVTRTNIQKVFDYQISSL